jgi:hypothetical protein
MRRQTTLVIAGLVGAPCGEPPHAVGDVERLAVELDLVALGLELAGAT